MMKMIKHKNIVKLKEVLASNSKIYLVLELIRGGDLFDVVRGKNLSLILTFVMYRQGRTGRGYISKIFLLDPSWSALLS